MNPLDWRGPEFLEFYAVFAAAVCVVIALYRRLRESMGGTIGGRLDNPYQIAYLRGGETVALQVAAMSLVDRGVLEIDDGKQEIQASRAHGETIEDPLEEALVSRFASSRPAKDLFRTKPPHVFGRYAEELKGHGLLPDDNQRMERLIVFAIAAAALVATAGAKISVALSRGRHNIGFLVILTAISLFAAYKVANPRLTVKGKGALNDLRTLFSGLRQQTFGTATGHDPRELTLVAAVFGFAALPLLAMPSRHLLAVPGSIDWSGGVDSGGDSSSSCGGGGGGCGGGGCGGCGS